MYEIESQAMSEDFFPCWQAAGVRLDQQVDGGIKSWLRAHPYPPFLEHLSFRLGNQLFFVRVEDVEGKVVGPGGPRGLAIVAEKANGHACVLPMRKQRFGGAWAADLPGWGLMDATTGRLVNPVSLIDETKVEMTPWELQDMAVQVVRDHLAGQGFELMSWQGNPKVDPSIWFVGKSHRPEWVVVRWARLPNPTAERPSHWGDIASACAKTGTTGHFASVGLVSLDQTGHSSTEAAIPLWRGHGMHALFTGLE